MAGTNDKSVDQQAPQATGQQQVRLRIDERNMKTSYANMVRTSSTAEEVLLDFGVSMPNPGSQPEGPAEFIFQVSDRIVLNYFSAKRLAITLGQSIRQHEEQFGELELDVNRRRKSGN